MLKKQVELPSIKNVQLTVLVCCLSYFLLHSTFFKGKVKSGNFGGFYCFFQVSFSKKLVFFLVGSNYINPEGNHGRLIEFLS